MTDEEIRALLLDGFVRSAELIGEYGHQMRSKAILGGPFGSGGYAIVSWWYVLGGMDRVRYFVVHTNSRVPIGYGWSTQEALAEARGMLTSGKRAMVEIAMGKAGRIVVERHTEARKSEELAREAAREEGDAQAARVRSVPKRRREIFEKSEGKCHYCSAVLALDGKWHIEHMQPKALLGPNDKSNLVASCVSCNHRKRDMTAEEFEAKLRAERDAA